MSRPRINPEEKVRDAFLSEVSEKSARYKIRQYDIAEEIGIKPPQMSVLLGSPEKISIGRLRKIIALLNLNPVIVLAFLGYSEKQIKAISTTNGC